MLPESPQAVVTFLWWLTLGLGLVVALIVTGLLAWIYHEAAVIHERVGRVWTVGQQAANNTVHIPLLYTTNALAARILNAAQRLTVSVAAIEQHARDCPGCPHCLSGR